MRYLLLVITGLIPLICGASLLVDNASSFASKLNITPLVMGPPILGFGSSLPELATSVVAAGKSILYHIPDLPSCKMNKVTVLSSNH